MGGRKMTKKKLPLKPMKPAEEFLWFPGHQPINLVASPIQIHPVATQGYLPPVVGVPIMREGFITETGFLDISPHAIL
jgi:hypothetical protein